MRFVLFAAAVLFASAASAQEVPQEPPAAPPEVTAPAPAPPPAPPAPKVQTKKVSGLVVGGLASAGAVGGGIVSIGCGICGAIIPGGFLLTIPAGCLLCGAGAGLGAWGGLMIEGAELDFVTVGAAAGTAIGSVLLSYVAAVAAAVAIAGAASVTDPRLVQVALLPVLAILVGGNVCGIVATGAVAGLLAPAEAPLKNTPPPPPPATHVSVRTAMAY